MLSLASRSLCSTFGGVPLSPFRNASTASLFCSIRLQPKISWQPLHIEARERAQKESPKARNRRLQRKEAAKRVGEELVKACIEQKIHEISSYDRNGFSRGERMKAFEYAVIRHGFIRAWKSDGDILLHEK